ncbi:hypothetical protein MMC32_003158 [Xylographa parallela]|nr:hypothetical protein [Xylographa parallela]
MSSQEKASTTPTYSPAETRLIQIAFKHMKGAPDCDWDAVALEYGYKDGKMARSKYGLAMHKYSKPTGTSSNGTSTASPAAKPSPRKRKAGKTDDAAANGPAKRGRGRPKVSAAEVQENEDDVEETEMKVKVEPQEATADHEGSDVEPAAKKEEEGEEV